ncbi:bacteriocin immunity protein [Marininema halotolerans]|uniref:Colicin immunity protein / pyocin immunity protein n=1 Tax=Marininema halotolerans TaxID=1155944 RepID=A0A1I6QJ50_9BACL|nr:bacteriocin immunity protein [Marininema halotolerans]SFS52486.1 Colicin immunity protein / pyocin immunity protein [Marininema halotolerans]
MKRLNREELVELVRRIIDVDGTEEEIDQMIDLFEEIVPNPKGSGLIFYPENEDVTPEEIVEEALHYEPIITPPPSNE